MRWADRRPLVLGLNMGHDRSACLVGDGGVRVAIAEERLSRVKHDIPRNPWGELYNSFPGRSVDYCLDACDLDYADIDLVVANTSYVLDPSSGIRRALRPDDVHRQCAELAGARVEVVGHHLAHAASAALCSGFDSAAVLVIDGGGSIVDYDDRGTAAAFERTSIFHLRGGELRLLWQAVGRPPVYDNSIGDLYQLITRFLGFREGEEGKTMGLAAYGGCPSTVDVGARWRPLECFRDAVVVDERCGVRIARELQFTADGHPPPELTELFGSPRDQPRPEQPLDRQLAASAQWAVEKAVLELAAVAHRVTGERRLCYAGGVALNCRANGRLLREGPFAELFVQPAATDDGTALGTALLGWQQVVRRPSTWVFRSAYLGRAYHPEEISAALPGSGLTEAVECGEQLADRIAEDIEAGLVVGVLRGGSEFGPRALGHRSILCDPRHPAVKDRLNRRVKHRESFRPFAPVVLVERAGDFFDLRVASPYMLLTADVMRPDLLPAVTHVDGSARVQTVSREEEPMLWELLCAFERRTGVPVLLNTSFNEHEPIVETPKDAVRCFLTTDLDVLYLEDRRVIKCRAPETCA